MILGAPPKRRIKGPPAGLRIVLNGSTDDGLATPSLAIQSFEPETDTGKPNDQATELSPLSAITGPSPFSSPNSASEGDSSAVVAPHPKPPAISVTASSPAGPKRFGRNRKNLSLSLQTPVSDGSLESVVPAAPPAAATTLAVPAAALSLPPTPQATSHRPSSFDPSRRRSSVASLPAITNRVHRSVEDAEPGAPYENGPIEILPGIWLGAEENARDWQGLSDRAIGAILNVAKEVPPPFTLSAASTLGNASNHKGVQAVAAKPTYHPADKSSGQPALSYLHMKWSHGQADLVQSGFPAAIEFVDRALEGGIGVLVHCQCGISRSATMIIALVMCAAHRPNASEKLLELKKGGMHAAYAYVKEKSPWVGPNMSLIYQLLEYERHLSPDNQSDASSVLSEEEEWSRRRREMEEESDDAAEKAAAIEAQEARELDQAMIDRFEGVKRKASAGSFASASSTGGTGMGVWMNRFGGHRNRTGSINSTSSRHSAVSEESVLEVDEESEDNEPLTAHSRQASISVASTTTSDDDDGPHTSKPTTFIISASVTPKSKVIPLQLPPPRKTLPRASPKPLSRSFSLPVPPSAPAAKSSFGHISVPVPFPRRTQSPLTPMGQPIVKRAIAKPPPLNLGAPPCLPPPAAHSRTDRRPRPAPLNFQPLAPAAGGKPNIVLSQRSPRRPQATYSSRPRQVSSAAPHQTLFIFPASPTRKETFAIPSTPSTLTLTSSSGFPFSPSSSSMALPTPTPTLSSFRKDSMSKRQSWLGGVPSTPTQGLSRVDARGWLAPGGWMNDFTPIASRKRV